MRTLGSAAVGVWLARVAVADSAERPFALLLLALLLGLLVLELRDRRGG